jgi:hypothetical protein
LTFRKSNSRTGKDKNKSSVTNTFNTMHTYDVGEIAFFSGFLEENVRMLFADCASMSCGCTTLCTTTQVFRISVFLALFVEAVTQIRSKPRLSPHLKSHEYDELYDYAVAPPPSSPVISPSRLLFPHTPI